ncbi:hypothetical protein GCM10023086_11120 [Streptomyces venetus]|uniref:Uncharacterized protein n=1 Tax=Streptomyces venetus TaxID=1701086 RepID=A0ABP8F7L3_9ACTN
MNASESNEADFTVPSSIEAGASKAATEPAGALVPAPPPTQGTTPATPPRRAEPAHVDFPPVENGVDYLRSVVDHLTDEDPPTPRALKYAVLHLQAAAEVLLKSRLLQEHWSLVFAEPSAATRKKFEAGNFNSCTTEAAIDRLRNIAGVDVDDKSAAALKKLAETRNALQHYGLTWPARAVEARAADVLDFLMGFVHAELAPALTAEPEEAERDEVQDGLAYVRARLSTIQSFLKRRHDQLRPELKKLLDLTVQCPLCMQWAVVIGSGGGPLSCRFCHHSWPSAEVAAVDIGLTGNDYCNLADCPDCGESAVLVDFATIASAPTHYRSVCFACGDVFDVLHVCESCEQHFDPDEESDLGLCPECLAVRVDRF